MSWIYKRLDSVTKLYWDLQKKHSRIDENSLSIKKSTLKKLTKISYSWVYMNWILEYIRLLASLKNDFQYIVVTTCIQT